MAHVYLAEDVRHERRVALKVLKPDLAAVVGADRFLAEIKTTANLQHPHVLPLFDSGEADGLLFYVMPFVEGESLRQRLERDRQLPVDEAVGIAERVAGALDHAHRHGVVHRDLKPANILLRDGQPLIADFGIALAVDTAGGGRLTETGLSLGTPQYMSPEQATGDRNVGAASDIYSLGGILYECLAGEPPYTGTTPQAILGRIVTTTPAPITEHRKSVPPNVEGAISRALEKLPADRFRSAVDFRAALSDSGFRHGGAPRPSRVDRWKIASLVSGAIAMALLGWIVRSDRSDLAYYNLDLPLAESRLSRVAVSPDGTRYAFIGSESGAGMGDLWIRHRSQPRAERLVELSGTGPPAFSPDGESVAVLQLHSGGRGTLLRVPLDGTGTLPITEGVLDRSGHSWGDDGYIYLGSPEGTLRVPEGGGELELVTRVDTAAGETGHHSPVILPGGEGIVFTVRYNPFRETGLYSIAVARTDDGAHRTLAPGVRAAYAAPGVLLHVSADGGLFATPFDAKRLELTGQTTPIADDVSVRGFGQVDLAVSENGRLVYGTVSGNAAAYELMRVSRDGSSRPLAPGWSADFRFVTVSPDGSRLLVDTGPSGTRDGRSALWVWSFDRGTRYQLATEEGIVIRPVWTPDGARVGYLSGARGTTDLWTVPPDGSSEPELVLDHDVDVAEMTWSRDGRWLAYRTTAQSRNAGDIWLLDVERGTREALLEAEYDETSPALSPDGRWMAYTSAATGRPEVWVATFPDVREARYKISEGGGTEPRWSPDGRELFYRDGNDDMVVVEVVDGEDLDFTAPHRLFSASSYRPQRYYFGYDIMPDGEEFVMIRGTSPGAVSRLVVIEDFRRLLDR